MLLPRSWGCTAKTSNVMGSERLQGSAQLSQHDSQPSQGQQRFQGFLGTLVPGHHRNPSLSVKDIQTVKRAVIMAAHAATARLRHTFHYPSESASSSDEADSVMDEQGVFFLLSSAPILPPLFIPPFPTAPPLTVPSANTSIKHVDLVRKTPNGKRENRRKGTIPNNFRKESNRD